MKARPAWPGRFDIDILRSFNLDAPLFTGPDDPALRPVVGTWFLLFLIGAGLQVWRLRAGRKPVVALTQA